MGLFLIERLQIWERYREIFKRDDGEIRENPEETGGLTGMLCRLE